MKASIGDRIVVVSPQVGGVVRDCLIVELRNPDGSPPYVVRWSDTGQEGLYFPGSDGRIQRAGGDVTEPATDAPTVAQADAGPPHVTTWNVEVQVFEQGPETSARAILHAGAVTSLEARGRAHRAPKDGDVPEIGDEVAVARALRHLADALLEAASGDISQIEHRAVTLTH
ncbi:MAG TPA: dsRBD fold-containing protein [Candidatus Angelobacter sp.]|nr:dsRBD fold-containing protein [Candidatus Angelobacter sp.]